MIPAESSWRRYLWPLRCRKSQVAIATIIASYAAHRGWVLDEQAVTQIIALGVALILGIAHEDAAEKSNGHK
jgi:hypothetical protein